MMNSTVRLAVVVLLLGLLSQASYGQLDGLYRFDGGGDGTSWDDAANWEQVTDPFGAPISGDPATPPGPTTSADIPLLGVVLIDSTQTGQTALDVNVGTSNGAGSVFITGGDITVRDFNVGSDSGGLNIGLLSISGGTLTAGDDITLGNGSVGIMVMSGGTASTSDDFDIHANSSLIMNGGSLNVGDRLQLFDNAGLVLSSGSIFADDDFYFFGNSQITVNGGSMIVNDKLRFDDSESFSGKLTINSGFVRSNEFGLEIDGLLTDFRGVVEINGDGIFQVEAGTVGSPISQLTLATAQALIAEGVHLTTSEPGEMLFAREVIVPSFDGRTNVSFIQISIIPEPATMALVGVCLVGLALQRKRSY